MKDVILSYGTHARFDDFRGFIASVRGVCRPQDVDVFVFIDQMGDEYGDLARRHDVTLIPVVNLWRAAQKSRILNAQYAASIQALKLASKRIGAPFDTPFRHAVAQWIHPQAGRWFAIADFLKINSGYRRVFLSDLRDVVFQADPFPEIHDDALHVCLQTGIRFSDPDCVDSRWYRDVYGEQALQGLGDAPTICCGTVFGGRTPVLQVVAAEVEEAMVHYRRPLDQAFFNHVIHRRSDGCKIVQHELDEGPVLTFVGTHRDHWKFRDGRVCIGDRVVPVLHMYDRDPELKAHFQGLYAQA